MPQFIELEDIIMQRMKVEVGGHHTGFALIRRILHRRKVKDVHVLRNNDHAARMLAGGALHLRAAERQTFLLGLVDHPVALGKVLLHISIGGLFGDSGDGTGLKDLRLSEQLDGVAMDVRLALAREIEIDIRLLVPLEAKEGFKRDIMAVLMHFSPAAGAVFVRQIEAGADRTVGNEFGVPALGADIMGRQRVDLRDAGHRRGKRGTDRPTRADLISEALGFGHQLLCRHIHDRKAVGNDRMQLLFQPFGDNLRQRLAVSALCPLPADTLQLVVRALDRRRIGP